VSSRNELPRPMTCYDFTVITAVAISYIYYTLDLHTYHFMLHTILRVPIAY